MSQARLENFRVASRALPAALRSDLYALYGFARLVDDLGDEARGDRAALLDWLEGDLDALYAGRPRHELMRRLQPTVLAHSIPPDPFRRLIAANRQDQEVASYETFDELVGYCRLSADPVGHLVLYVFDSATPERMVLADRICTALQVVEHIQDVGEDLARGRVYLPQEDMRASAAARRTSAAAPHPSPLRRADRARGHARRGACSGRGRAARPHAALARRPRGHRLRLGRPGGPRRHRAGRLRRVRAAAARVRQRRAAALAYHPHPPPRS